MSAELPSDPPANDAAPDPGAERLATVRRRLAEGFYQRPEVLDRIAAAVRRAIGRAG